MKERINNKGLKNIEAMKQEVVNYTPIPLDGASTARMAIMALIRNRSRSAGICKNLRLLRFHYASSTLLVRSCYASHDAATV